MEKKKKNANILAKKDAFTLIELVMVILLIGILAAVVLPKFVNLTGSANKAASQGVVGSLGEGVTTQLSKDLVNNDLSSYVTVAAGVPAFTGTTPSSAGTQGANPYANPFLNLPNYTISSAANNGNGTGTVYNYGSAASGKTGNSWWLNYSPKTPSNNYGATSAPSITLTCDNSGTNGTSGPAWNANYVAPVINIPINEGVTQIGNIDYIYSNGATMDSYAYYMVSSVNNNIEGFYLVPCQS